MFHPHEARQSHAARHFTRTDWLQDGEHELRVTRQSDDSLLRAFKFTVAAGAMVPLPRTVLGHQPALDYLPPRVAKRNVNIFEVHPAIWLESK